MQVDLLPYRVMLAIHPKLTGLPPILSMSFLVQTIISTTQNYTLLALEELGSESVVLVEMQLNF